MNTIEQTTMIKMMEMNPVVIDDHTGKEEKLTGLVEFNNPNKGLACCFDARYYSLNLCTLEEDRKLHCSQLSIGGVLWGGYPDVEQINEYNDSCPQDGGKIKCIHKPDGTKVYADTFDEYIDKGYSPLNAFFKNKLDTLPTTAKL